MGIKKYREQLVEAAKQLQCALSELGIEERERLRVKVANKYAGGHTHWLWNYHGGDAQSIRHPDAWQWVDDFVRNSEVILFFNSGDDLAMFRVNGTDLVAILGEFTDEFYVTNENGDFLIAYNHHEYLVACGTAKPWLEGFTNDRK